MGRAHQKGEEGVGNADDVRASSAYQGALDTGPSGAGVRARGEIPEAAMAAAWQPDAPPIRCKAMLYERALHPSGVVLHGRQLVRCFVPGDRRRWEAEVWVLDGGHVAIFGHGESHESHGWWASELVVSPAEIPVPVGRIVMGVAVQAERDVCHGFGEGVVYMCSMQTETLSARGYEALRTELLSGQRRARAGSGLVHEWATPEGGLGLSVVTIEPGVGQVSIWASHLLPREGVTVGEADGGGRFGEHVRTQTIFEVKGVDRTGPCERGRA